MVEGRPLAAGGEIVRLERRADGAGVFDVKVECKLPDGAATPQATTDRSPASPNGPPQVATRAYRENWELVFGGSRDESLN